MTQEGNIGMDGAGANLLIAMIEALLASQESQPSVVFSDPHVRKTVELLPASWHKEASSAESFADRVSAALLNGPVVAFPPWGRREGSLEPLEALALQGIRSSGGGHPLLAVLPPNVLVSPASEALRVDLAKRWQLQAVVTCDAAIVDAHRAFVAGLVFLGPTGQGDGLIRMFEAPHGPRRMDQQVIEDFHRLLRMKGGTTDYGYVLRDPLTPGTPLAYRLHDPRVVRRRAELGDYGRSAQLDDLFEIWSGVPMVRLRMAEPVEARSAGSGRIVGGRDVLASHQVAPEDEDSAWANPLAAS